MVLHSSHIRHFRIAKRRLRPNEATYATGELWHCLFNLPWICDPKLGEVRLQINGTEYDRTQSGAGGVFYLTLVAPMTPGTYFVYAHHPGITAIQGGCDSDRVTINVEENPKECYEYMTIDECIAGGCYWWGGACHPYPDPGPDWPKIAAVGIATMAGAIILITAVKIVKREK